MNDWKFDARQLTQFEMRPDHLKLLRRMNVEWEDCEFGAPSIDCKRPYGNSGVYDDIAEILGFVADPDPDADERFTPDQEAQMNRLHRETMTALQVVLDTGTFRDGTYVREKYREWRLVR